MNSPASGYWPESAQAAAYLARVQALLDARGLDGTAPRFKTLMTNAVAAFKARDLAGVAAACDALIDAIEDPPAGA